MLRRLVSLVVAAVVLGGCGSDQHSGTSVLSSNGGLLISSDWTGDWEVFVMDPESPILHQVVLHQVTHEGAYVVAGASQSEVEGFDFEGTWSPDGEQIALTTDRYEGFHLVIVDRDGQVLKRLTTGVGNGEPSWSPDGNQIAFRSDRTMDVELFVINVDGSDVYQLTQSPGEDWTPTWSPDGARLAFSSRRYNGTWDIFTTLPDGTGISQLTSDEWDNWLPDWSPDGSRIAFSSNRDGNWDIFTMDTSGSSLRQVTTDSSLDFEPVWSPDGSRLAFASTRGVSGALEIFFVDLGSGTVSASGKSGYPTDWLVPTD